jgi:hypothetical protein
MRSRVVCAKSLSNEKQTTSLWASQQPLIYSENWKRNMWLERFCRKSWKPLYGVFVWCSTRIIIVRYVSSECNRLRNPISEFLMMKCETEGCAAGVVGKRNFALIELASEVSLVVCLLACYWLLRKKKQLKDSSPLRTHEGR